MIIFPTTQLRSERIYFKHLSIKAGEKRTCIRQLQLI